MNRCPTGAWFIPGELASQGPFMLRVQLILLLKVATSSFVHAYSWTSSDSIADTRCT